MGRRVEVRHDYRNRVPGDWRAFAGAEGEVVARSGSTETVRTAWGEVDLHLKRYRYGLLRALKGALRNTLLGPSRARREYEMLLALRAAAGDDAAPAPVAFGEHRRIGLLLESFVATETVPGAADLDAASAPDPRSLARFVAGIHRAGFSHGGLFARNVLVRPDGTYAVVDLARARRRSRDADRARDLAFLDESLGARTARSRLRALAEYLGPERSCGDLRRWVERIGRFRTEAADRLARRNRPAVEGDSHRAR